VLYAFREESALADETALKIACGLGAGMGRKEEVCGAVTGGILVLGMRHGRGGRDERSAMELTYAKTRELMDFLQADTAAASVGNCLTAATFPRKQAGSSSRIRICSIKFAGRAFKRLQRFLKCSKPVLYRSEDN